MNAFQTNIRIIVLSLYLLFCFVVLFAYRLDLQKVENTEYVVVYDWLACRLEVMWGFPGATIADCPDPNPPQPVPYSLHFANDMIVMTIGFVLFLVFGSDKSIYTTWRQVLHQIYIKITRKFYSPKNGGKRGLELSTTTSTIIGKNPDSSDDDVINGESVVSSDIISSDNVNSNGANFSSFTVSEN